MENLLIVNIPTSRCSALRILTHTKRRLIRVKWFFVRTAARARSDPARDAGRLAMARSFHVNVRHEISLDSAGGPLYRSRPTTHAPDHWPSFNEIRIQTIEAAAQGEDTTACEGQPQTCPTRGGAASTGSKPGHLPVVSASAKPRSAGRTRLRPRITRTFESCTSYARPARRARRRQPRYPRRGRARNGPTPVRVAQRLT